MLEGSDKCVDCKNFGQGSLDNQCVDCDTILEGSIFWDYPTKECKCPENKILSKDGTKCEECPPNQIPSEDGTKCEKEEDGTPNGDDWCPIPCWDGVDDGQGNIVNYEWCNAGNCRDGAPACSPDGNLAYYHRCQKCSTIKQPPRCNRSGGKEGEGEDCTDPTGCSEEDPTEMPSATPDMPSLPGSDSGSDAAAEETPSTTDRPSLPGSDSASDATAEETPSTTATPPLPGSDTPTVNAN